MSGAARRVGLFVTVTLAVLIAATVLVSGDWFRRTESAQLRFEGTLSGLQPGASVMYRGVRLGYVTAVELVPLGAADDRLRVRVQLDRETLAQLLPAGAGGAADAPLVPRLVAAGLHGSLVTQSLLTGLMVLELDLHDASRRASAAALAPDEIPTVPTTIQGLQRQLEQVDWARTAQDLQESVAQLRRLLADPAWRDAATRLAGAASSVDALARDLRRDAPGLVTDSRAAARAARVALEGPTLPAVRGAAEEAASAAAAVRALADSGRAAVPGLARAADELAAAARALQEGVAEDGSLRVESERALRDVGRAARALRELAATLERQPGLLLRGRSTEEER